MRFPNAVVVAAVLVAGALGPLHGSNVHGSNVEWLNTVQETGRSEMPPSLRVAGEAEVGAEPDRAVVTLGATAQAPAATAAQQEVSRIMERAIAAIEEAGVPRQRIRTAALSLHPVISPGRRLAPGETEDPRIIGYRASNTVRVELDEPAAIGGVIDAGIGAGANQLQGIHFGLRDDTEQRAEALRQAVRNARLKAEALAEAAGVELLALHRIDEGMVETYPDMHRRTDMAAMEIATPIQPGQVQVHAAVTLTYRIGPAPGEGEEEQER